MEPMYENAHEVETLINAVTRAVQGPCYAGMGSTPKTSPERFG